MSRLMETMTGITLATIAVHFFTGQGKATAIILIADSIMTGMALIDRMKKRGRK